LSGTEGFNYPGLRLKGGIEMRMLIAEDDMVSRKFLLKFLSQYGECDVVVDGMEALDAYLISVKENEPYDVICLDIMMPKVDGVKVLKAIRDFEKQRGVMPDKKVKIMMITALDDTEYVHKAFEIGCEAYAAKPIDTDKLIEVMKKLEIIKTV
jgi:two-component system chemotaxis response regulator CheY